MYIPIWLFIFIVIMFGFMLCALLTAKGAMNMFDDFTSYDLERKRKVYESQEKEICKDCRDRAGLPCLFVFSCDKLKGGDGNGKGISEVPGE